MARSWLSSVPFDAPKPAVPWGWNPAATFMTAYYDAQENQREQQEFQMKAELQRILLPQKQAEAEFNLKKLAYDSKLIEESFRARTAVLDAQYRAATSSGRSGSGSNAAGSVGSPNQQQVTDPRNPLFYFQSRNTTPAPAPTTGQPAPTGKKVKLVF